MRIEDLRALLEAATPGPWKNTRHGCGVIGHGKAYVVGHDRGEPEDAALIAALRNAAPALLAVVDAAREIADEQRSACRRIHDWEPDCNDFDRRGTACWWCDLRAALDALEAS